MCPTDVALAAGILLSPLLCGFSEQCHVQSVLPVPENKKHTKVFFHSGKTH
jgi:hypothetical protein